MRKLACLVLVLAALGATCRSPAPQAAAWDREFGEAKLAVSLKEPAINESSGLARSYRFPGSYYTHNDSGDSPRFWRFDLKGKIWGPYAVRNAQAIDWEDMASAKLDGKPYLYFADIGDNGVNRESVQVYRVEEPAAEAKTVAATRFELIYPDGPHNAEAFMVDPKTGAMLIVSKTNSGPSYAYQFDMKKGAGPIVGKSLGPLELGGVADAEKLVTGGDIDAAGRKLVLRTYAFAHEFDYASDAPWCLGKPYRIKTAAEIQGEAIAYSLDGKTLLTTSEFSPCPVSAISILKAPRRS